MPVTRADRTQPLARFALLLMVTALMLMVTALMLAALLMPMPVPVLAATADQTPPVTTAALPSGWQNQDVTVILSATDENSGVAATYWQLGTNPVQQGTSLVIRTEGIHSLSFWSVDNAGNAESPKTVTVQIDKMSPSIMGNATNGWSNQPITVTFTCADNLSGVKFCQPPITANDEGWSISVSGIAEDNAGNVTIAVSTVKIDLTAPTINGTVDRAANSAGWYDAPVTLSFTCADALSGVGNCPTPVTVSTEGANQSVVRTANDLAGNVATATINGLNLDFTAPTIIGLTDRAPNAAGWFNAPVTVSFACTDALSGVADCTGESTLRDEGIGQMVAGSASDLAGNRATGAVTGIKIDLTAPVLSFAGNVGRYDLDEQIQITCSATDSLSGIAASTCQTITGPAYSFALGTNSFVATATDNAGNLGSGSVSFEVVASYDSLCALTQRVAGKDGIGKALCAKLDAAKASAARGQAGPPDAYINQVQAQSGKGIPVDQAEILIMLAQRL